MVRCVPERPRFRSGAEEQVWALLKAGLGPADVLLGNVAFTDDRGDREADLVAGLADVGVVVIEVKGGRVWHDGQSWCRHGSRIDPVGQAREAKHKMLAYLKRDPRWGSRRLPVAHAIALPNVVVPAGFATTDCSRDMVLDRDDLGDDPVGRLRGLLARQETRGRRPSAADLDRLVQCLAGRGLPQRDLVAELADRDTEVARLTAGQQAILQAARDEPRIQVVGGAGTGKTWLAATQAGRLAAAGDRVALLCYNVGLAGFLQRWFATTPSRPAYVGTFADLGAAWGVTLAGNDDSDFWERRLPNQMLPLAEALPPEGRFDALVVDEAQDFAAGWWRPLLAALRDPDTGRLYVFTDPQQRVFPREGEVPVRYVQLHLDDNLRNTKPIAQTFQDLAPPGLACRGGAGAPVRFVACPTEEAVDRADDEVERLLEGGWPSAAVALLTTGHRHPEQVNRERAGRDSYWQEFWSGDEVAYGHVLGFKGLERPAVVLAVNGFVRPEQAREALYVGLSRARDQLVVCADPALLVEVAGAAILRRLPPPAPPAPVAPPRSPSP